MGASNNRMHELHRKIERRLRTYFQDGVNDRRWDKEKGDEERDRLTNETEEGTEANEDTRYAQPCGDSVGFDFRCAT